MATWITHLRIAEIVFQNLPELDEVSFLYGNLAPDSGLPNEDWTQFEPPRKVTHFLDEENHIFTDVEFFVNFVRDLNWSDQKLTFSFRLGYFVHLITDQFWWRNIVRTTENTNQELFSIKTRGEAFDFIKTDWYDLDHKYLRDHPRYTVWEKFYQSDIPQIPLPFLPQNAFEIQMQYIKEYYTSTDPDRVLDRVFPYLNMKTLDRFIKETSAVVINIIKILRKESYSIPVGSSLGLLSNAEAAAYEPPLGDLNEYH